MEKRPAEGEIGCCNVRYYNAIARLARYHLANHRVSVPLSLSLCHPSSAFAGWTDREHSRIDFTL